jgi:hypothetical protein
MPRIDMLAQSLELYFQCNWCGQALQAKWVNHIISIEPCEACCKPKKEMLQHAIDCKWCQVNECLRPNNAKCLMPMDEYPRQHENQCCYGCESFSKCYDNFTCKRRKWSL